MRARSSRPWPRSNSGPRPRRSLCEGGKPRRDMRNPGRSTRVLMTAALLAAGGSLLAQTGPAPTSTHLASEVIALACGPTLAYQVPAPSLLVTGGQDASTRHMFHAGDLVTINGGSDNGIEVGQEYYVRMVQGEGGSGISRA